MLLIVEAEVLGSVHDALVGAALQDAVTHTVGEHRILGDVLIVTAVVRRAALGQAGAPQIVLLEPQTGVALDETPFISEIGVEGGCKQGLGVDVEAVGGAGRFIGIGSGEARNAFVLGDNGVIDVGQGIRLAAAVDDRADRFVDRDLGYELIPEFIVNVLELLILDIGGIKSETAVNAFGCRIVGLNGVGLTSELGKPFIGLRAVGDLDLYFVVVDRVGAVPILTGEVGDGVLAGPVVQVGIVCYVGNDGVILNGEGLAVERIERPCCDSSLALGVHTVFDLLALLSQEVVDSLVRACGSGEEIVALVKDISLGVLIVIACEILGRNGDGDFLSRAGSYVDLCGV